MTAQPLIFLPFLQGGPGLLLFPFVCVCVWVCVCVRARVHAQLCLCCEGVCLFMTVCVGCE